MTGKRRLSESENEVIKNTRTETKMDKISEKKAKQLIADFESMARRIAEMEVDLEGLGKSTKSSRSFKYNCLKRVGLKTLEELKDADDMASDAGCLV